MVVEKMLMEVVARGWKLHCEPWMEVVSHATPPHLVKVKINFDEAQKLAWKEIKCLYGLIITSNHISELLKMQLELRSQNAHTLGTLSRFISTLAVTMQKSIRGSHIGKLRICVCLQLVYSNHCSIIVLFLVSSSTYGPHTIIAAKTLTHFLRIWSFQKDLVTICK